METGEKSDFEKKKNDISDKNKGNNKPSRKPNWPVCFFKVLASVCFDGFLGKNLITGKKDPNRFLNFFSNIFFLTIKALPIALFISYFLITLPTWIFVLAIVRMAWELFKLVELTNSVRISLAQRQKPIKYSEEKQQKEEEGATNHVKAYEYGNRYYKNKPTTLIGDFFRLIGNRYFAFLFGKNFMSGEKIERSKWAKFNIGQIIFTSLFEALVISCFLIPVPTWLFVLAIVSAVARLAEFFCFSYLARQRGRKDLFFCKCEGEDKVHASFKQVAEEYRLDNVPELDVIELKDIHDCVS